MTVLKLLWGKLGSAAYAGSFYHTVCYYTELLDLQKPLELTEQTVVGITMRMSFNLKKKSHLLQHIHQWPASISPKHLQTGHV